jgi:hypothetical protein
VANRARQPHLASKRGRRPALGVSAGWHWHSSQRRLSTRGSERQAQKVLNQVVRLPLTQSKIHAAVVVIDDILECCKPSVV